MFSGDKQIVALICLDSSNNSNAALQWYLKKIHKPNNIIGIVHVYIPPSTPSCYSGGLLPSVQDILQENDALVGYYRDVLASHGIVDAKFFIEPINDSVGNTICKIGKDNNASFILTGQRGVSTLQRKVFGSVTDYILHHADRPVLVVPPQTTYIN
ncbi:uncharacterized protein LOC130621545 [Hydractinia symbiolongicarpus]|uniref:uncharacterized protein LOC130621545 n=1 Tax=Hydractinia symbiolongicarpus TaxID=13093 RepID=UPI00254A84C2|nr:uncharacterized protein LOC130621545 [Hydractinia symbiolongicarpus]